MKVRLSVTWECLRHGNRKEQGTIMASRGVAQSDRVIAKCFIPDEVTYVSDTSSKRE